jgi:hypothetical protein
MTASPVWPKYLLAALLWLPAFAASAQDARPVHPLDALTAGELRQVLAEPAAQAHRVSGLCPLPGWSGSHPDLEIPGSMLRTARE